MGKASNISALIVLLASLALLAFFQWLPALLLLPVAGALFTLNPQGDQLQEEHRPSR